MTVSLSRAESASSIDLGSMVVIRDDARSEGVSLEGSARQLG